jgi:hypothetical protein
MVGWEEDSVPLDSGIRGEVAVATSSANAGVIKGNHLNAPPAFSVELGAGST